MLQHNKSMWNKKNITNLKEYVTLKILKVKFITMKWSDHFIRIIRGNMVKGWYNWLNIMPYDDKFQYFISSSFDQVTQILVLSFW